METKAGKTAFAVPRQRRSVVWNIGDCLIKLNPHYRAIYLARKAVELPKVQTVNAKGKIEPHKMHAHRRAQRVMEQQFLIDLWCAWNGVERTNAGQPSSR